MIFWGMGISQHIHGTDNARFCCPALMTGHWQARFGLHPLRGQNNVQGASDVGLIRWFILITSLLKIPLPAKYENCGSELDSNA
jgi:formate dehydrogenase major subunit